MTRPSAHVKTLLRNIGAEVFAELGGAAQGWQLPVIRATTETEVTPWMIFTIIGPLDDDTHVADEGRSAQVAAMVYINVTFEISESDEHYLSTFDGRCAAVRAIQRVLSGAPPSLVTEWKGEEEAQVRGRSEGVVISQSRVLIAWQEPT